MQVKKRSNAVDELPASLPGARTTLLTASPAGRVGSEAGPAPLRLRTQWAQKEVVICSSRAGCFRPAREDSPARGHAARGADRQARFVRTTRGQSGLALLAQVLVADGERGARALARQANSDTDRGTGNAGQRELLNGRSPAERLRSDGSSEDEWTGVGGSSRKPGRQKGKDAVQAVAS